MLVQVGKRYVSEQRDIDPFFSKSMRELLKKSKVFADCHDEFIRDLIVASNRKEYAANRYIMEEGMRGDSMFVIFKGVVEVTSNGRYVCKLRDGSIVGEAALLNIDNKRTASVRTTQQCEVAILYRSTFHSILENYPWEKRKFQRGMKNKLVELGKLVDLKEDINLEQQSVMFDMLKQVPFFADDESLHDFAAELAMSGTTAWYRPGKVIIQEGDSRCDEMYALLHGAVEVTACGEFLGRLEHDLFGEICVMDVLENRTANVTAATEVHCMIFPRQVVVAVLTKYPDGRMRLLEHARQRLLHLNQIVSPGKPQLEMLEAPPPGCAIGFGNVIRSDDARMLAASSVFRKAPLKFARDLSEKLSDKKVQVDDTVISEGDTIISHKDPVYFIAKGTAEVWKGNTYLKALTQGDIFGDEMVFDLKKNVRDVTVKAKTPLVLRTVNLVHLLALMEEYKGEGTMEDFNTAWAEHAAQRQNHMAQLEVSRALSHKPGPKMDVMFLKLPVVGAGGVTTPRAEPLKEALLGISGPHSSRVRQGLELTDLPPMPKICG
mmetsp:Transcript_8205/g.18360  ORF Transcript_8205/g.18360 Transcript_8205/m.18360 type:complete len:548 (+) Transcript_8205:127-1770(+)